MKFNYKLIFLLLFTVNSFLFADNNISFETARNKALFSKSKMEKIKRELNKTSEKKIILKKKLESAKKKFEKFKQEYEKVSKEEKNINLKFIDAQDEYLKNQKEMRDIFKKSQKNKSK